jgi:hypothetical protein
MMTEEWELWIGMVEIWGHPDCSVLGEAEGAFTHVVTWARGASEFREKAEILAGHLQLQILSFETEPVTIRERRGGVDGTS